VAPRTCVRSWPTSTTSSSLVCRHLCHLCEVVSTCLSLLYSFIALGHSRFRVCELRRAIGLDGMTPEAGLRSLHGAHRRRFGAGVRGKRTSGGHRLYQPNRCPPGRRRPAREKGPGDRRDQGVAAHARLDGQRTQPQRRWRVSVCLDVYDLLVVELRGLVETFAPGMRVADDDHSPADDGESRASSLSWPAAVTSAGVSGD
jgi:hypothetical protein